MLCRLFLSVLIIFCLGGCRFKDYKGSIETGDHDLTKDIPADQKITYALLDSVIFDPKCSKCHAPWEKIDLTTYDAIREYIEPGSPQRSKLYQMIASGDMPRESRPLSDAEKQLIARWITEGASEK